MAAYAMDLHNHMPIAGGDYKGAMSTSGRDVVGAALAAGIDVLGVTDHFCLDFFRKVEEAAVGTGLLILPGVEMRLSWMGDEAHLVAVLPPADAEERFTRLMRSVGFDSGSHPGGLHHVVLERDPVSVACQVESLGGTCCVAHVDRYFGAYRLLGRPLLDRLVDESSVAALEFLDRDGAPRPLSRRIACIESSDSHSIAEIGRRTTSIDADELSFDGVTRALAEGLVG